VRCVDSIGFACALCDRVLSEVGGIRSAKKMPPRPQRPMVAQSLDAGSSTAFASMASNGIAPNGVMSSAGAGGVANGNGVGVGDRAIVSAASGAGPTTGPALGPAAQKVFKSASMVNINTLPKRALPKRGPPSARRQHQRTYPLTGILRSRARTHRSYIWRSAADSIACLLLVNRITYTGGVSLSEDVGGAPVDGDFKGPAVSGVAGGRPLSRIATTSRRSPADVHPMGPLIPDLDCEFGIATPETGGGPSGVGGGGGGRAEIPIYFANESEMNALMAHEPAGSFAFRTVLTIARGASLATGRLFLTYKYLSTLKHVDMDIRLTVQPNAPPSPATTARGAGAPPNGATAADANANAAAPAAGAAAAVAANTTPVVRPLNGPPAGRSNGTAAKYAFVDRETDGPVRPVAAFGAVPFSIAESDHKNGAANGHGNGVGGWAGGRTPRTGPQTDAVIGGIGSFGIAPPIVEPPRACCLPARDYRRLTDTAWTFLPRVRSFILDVVRHPNFIDPPAPGRRLTEIDLEHLLLTRSFLIIPLVRKHSQQLC
jgi:hypothetical protein